MFVAVLLDALTLTPALNKPEVCPLMLPLTLTCTLDVMDGISAAVSVWLATPNRCPSTVFASVQRDNQDENAPLPG